MNKIEIKITSDNNTLELNLEGQEQNYQKDLLNEMLDRFYKNNRKSEITHNLKKWNDGYNQLKKEENDLHNPKSEYERSYSPGIKIKHGDKKYQLYYICSNCGHKGKHFIGESREIVSCHECHEEMKVRQATHNYLEQDEYNNYFIAGEFRKTLADV